VSDFDAVRHELNTLKERLDQEAGLRVSQDRDLSNLQVLANANASLLQALATTQSHHTAVLAEHTAMLASHGFALNRIESGMANIVSMLNTLIDREQGSE
jgi:hypothetical protein